MVAVVASEPDQPAAAARLSKMVNVTIAIIFTVMQLSVIAFVFHLHLEVTWLEQNQQLFSSNVTQNRAQQAGQLDVSFDNNELPVRQKRDRTTVSEVQVDSIRQIIVAYYEKPNAFSHLCLYHSQSKHENLNWTAHCTSESEARVINSNNHGLRFIYQNILQLTRSGYHYVYLQLSSVPRGSKYDDRPRCAFYVEVIRARSKTSVKQNLLTLQISRYGSSYIGGVFLLHEGDQLLVRPEVTNRCPLSHHKEQSFFGLFLLAPDDIFPPPSSNSGSRYRRSIM